MSYVNLYIYEYVDMDDCGTWPRVAFEYLLLEAYQSHRIILNLTKEKEDE